MSYGSTTFQHNAMGQRSSKTAGSGTTTYDYDELGNLAGVDLPAKSIDYVVDGLNRRVARKVDGTVTNRYLYGQGLLLIAELNQDGTVKARFVYASKGHVPDYMIKGGITYRFVTDQVGSVRLVVNTADGTIAQRIDYDPYGKVLGDTNPGFQPFGFAGGLYDADTGLVRFGARDYDADTGRWTAKDPILFDGGDSNLYAYVGNDPVNFIDPTGEFAWIPFLAGAYALFEIGSTLWDVWNAGSTLLDDCASAAEKMASVVFVIAGIAGPGGGYSKADDVIEETLSGGGNITSKHVVSADEALEAGERWVGPVYEEIDTGVFRGQNGRQFRIDEGSLRGKGNPSHPHIHLEAYHPGANKPWVNNHVKFYD